MGIKLYCKICGKELKSCMSCYESGLLYWKNIACCKEHFIEYINKESERRRLEK